VFARTPVRTPSRAAHTRRALLAAGGLTVALLATDVAGAAGASAATATDFARLRQCESSGNYAINTGNGYYGAYQFSVGTWQSLGYAGLPSKASPATQDAAARRLQAARGWAPWPGCARKLGLGTANAAPAPAPAPAIRASRTRAIPLKAASPAFAGHVLSVRDRQQRRADVLIWQRQMAKRGFRISVDGHFGPQSAGAARRFAVRYRVHTRHLGTVDRAVWTSTWTAKRV
jgi:resuscitation-promoting factor RpfA